MLKKRIIFITTLTMQALFCLGMNQQRVEEFVQEEIKNIYDKIALATAENEIYNTAMDLIEKGRE